MVSIRKRYPDNAEMAAYLEAVNATLSKPGHSVMTTTRCTECDMDLSEMTAETLSHWVMLDAARGEYVVVIGCEGYWLVNPNDVGIHSPNWYGIEGVNVAA